MTMANHHATRSRTLFLVLIASTACAPEVRDDTGNDSTATSTDTAVETRSAHETADDATQQETCTVDADFTQCRDSVDCGRIGALWTSGSVSEDGAPCISDLYSSIGCTPLPCEPYDGYACRDGTDAMVYIGERVQLGDGVHCIPEGWHPCHTDVEPTFCLGD